MDEMNKTLEEPKVERMITRDEAIALLYSIAPQIDKRYLLKLGELIYCIQAEQLNYHCWGGDPTETAWLFLSPESHRITNIDREELKRIYMKYRYGLSKSDMEERELAAKEYDEFLQSFILKGDDKNEK
jgi:hypothetical protein